MKQSTGCGGLGRVDVRNGSAGRRVCSEVKQISIEFHCCRVIKLSSYHSALRIRRLASWIPCLLLIDHTTLDFRRR